MAKEKKNEGTTMTQHCKGTMHKTKQNYKIKKKKTIKPCISQSQNTFTIHKHYYKKNTNEK